MVSHICLLVELGPICYSMAASLCLKSCEDHSLLKIYNGGLWKNNYRSGPFRRDCTNLTRLVQTRQRALVVYGKDDLARLTRVAEQIHVYVINTGLEVIKLEFILKLKIKCNDWLLADTCPQAANRCALFWYSLKLKIKHNDWLLADTCPLAANRCALF